MRVVETCVALLALPTRAAVTVVAFRLVAVMAPVLGTHLMAVVVSRSPTVVPLLVGTKQK